MTQVSVGGAPALEAADVQKAYLQATGEVVQALSGLSFAVQQGEFVALMGPSGSGKTTLLNLLAGLDEPSAGELRVGGTCMSSLSGDVAAEFRRTRLGFVFQDFNLLDTLTLYENVALPLLLQGRRAGPRVDQVMDHLGVAKLRDRFPYQVSGGQQQRVAVARALVHAPAVLLADEPTGSLDSRTAEHLLEAFDRLHREHAVTILMVTHDAKAASYADRVVFIRDGRYHSELGRDVLMAGRAFQADILHALAELEAKVIHAQP